MPCTRTRTRTRTLTWYRCFKRNTLFLCTEWGWMTIFFPRTISIQRQLSHQWPAMRDAEIKLSKKSKFSKKLARHLTSRIKLLFASTFHYNPIFSTCTQFLEITFQLLKIHTIWQSLKHLFLHLNLNNFTNGNYNFWNQISFCRLHLFKNDLT